MGIFQRLMEGIKKKPAQTDFQLKYYVGKELGKGAFATVKLVTRKEDARKFAVKIIDRKKAKGDEEAILTEIEVLKQLKHRNIVELVDLFQTNDQYLLVMELATGGELFDRILAKGSYCEKDAALLMRQLLQALVYLHDEVDIVHRDIKPENLLFRDTTESSDLLLTDFGLSRIVQKNDFLSTSCGTPHYVAPEVLKESGHGKPVDMWACGVMAYVLLCGYTPFWGGNSNDMPTLYKAIISGKFEYDAEFWDMISEIGKDFISKLLVVDPLHRLTASQALSHPWISNDFHTDLSANIRLNFKARRTFKKAVLAVAMINRMSSQASSSKSTEDVGEDLAGLAL